MKTRLICCLIILLLGASGFSQKFKSIECKIHFTSDAPMEVIEATNSAGMSILDLSNGKIAFSIPVNQFLFEKSLMQEHFNENYMETDKYPKAIFLGMASPYQFKEGINQVKVEGEMDLHGVKKKLSVDGVIVKAGERLVAHAEFKLLLQDFNIKVPKAVYYNIAEEIVITIDFTYASS